MPRTICQRLISISCQMALPMNVAKGCQRHELALTIKHFSRRNRGPRLNKRGLQCFDQVDLRKPNITHHQPLHAPTTSVVVPTNCGPTWRSDGSKVPPVVAGPHRRDHLQEEVFKRWQPREASSFGGEGMPVIPEVANSSKHVVHSISRSTLPLFERQPSNLLHASWISKCFTSSSHSCQHIKRISLSIQFML